MAIQALFWKYTIEMAENDLRWKKGEHELIKDRPVLELTPPEALLCNMLAHSSPLLANIFIMIKNKELTVGFAFFCNILAFTTRP